MIRRKPRNVIPLNTVIPFFKLPVKWRPEGLFRKYETMTSTTNQISHAPFNITFFLGRVSLLLPFNIRVENYTPFVLFGPKYFHED